jgi:hypothetical protein
MAAALSLALTGPGAYSLDHALGIRVPKELAALAMLAVTAGVIVAESTQRPAATEATAAAGTEQAGEGGAA